jgi:hypothetical protein
VQDDPFFAMATLLVGLALWTLAAPIGGFAVTQLGIATIAPEAPLATLVLLEVGPTILLLALLTEHGLSLHMLGMAVAFTLALAGVTLAGFVYGGSLLAAGVALLIAVALCSYELHRYELVTLDLVDGENA